MRGRDLLLAAMVIGAAPLLCLLLLAGSGSAAVPAVLVAMVAVAMAALGLGWIWSRDLARLAAIVTPAGASPSRRKPMWLPVHGALGSQAERALEAQVRRAAAAEQAYHAEQKILESLTDPLVILDPDFRVRRANAAARGDFAAEVAAALRHPTLRAGIDRALMDGAPQRADLVLPTPVPRELQAVVTVLDPTLGEDRVMVLLADRTRERAVERMRADFVANAGHELRTPLASLIGFIETLQGPAADDPVAQRRFLGIMAEQAARMHRLIDDLLSLSRIELIEHQRPADQVDLAGVVAHAAAAFEPALLTRQATLEQEIDPALPRVQGDADQLAQVLQNLLDNALKHGGMGVRIRLIAASAHSDGRWPVRPGAVLSVADTGPGIAGQHIPRVTERFYRVDASRSRVAGGTGLGLAIVKHIVNRHRGQLRIESQERIGTTISIWLPTT
jgi:two-component system, OmpR family, phosphate regulon sensor histidine kinase PhoR